MLFYAASEGNGKAGGEAGDDNGLPEGDEGGFDHQRTGPEVHVLEAFNNSLNDEGSVVRHKNRPLLQIAFDEEAAGDMVLPG